MQEITLGSLCCTPAGQVQLKPDTIIDYIDISSVSNETKSITGYTSMPFSEAPSRARKAIKDKSILVSTVRPNLNAIAVFDKPTPNVPVASTGFSILDCKEKVDYRFIYHYCKSTRFINQMVGQATGASYPAVNDGIIRSALLPNYSFDEQKRISKLLDKIETIIRSRKNELQAFDTLVKARFVEIFGDPVSNPKGWKKETMISNATLLNGRAYKQEELLDNGKYPVLRVGNFFSNRGWYYSDLELEEDKYCDNGDLLYAWSASFGPQIWNGGRVIYHYHIWKVLVGEAYDKQFLCKLLEYVTESLMSDTHGIAMMHLTKNGMEQTEFIVPPIDLQKRFSMFCKQIDKSKSVIQQALAKDQLLFDSLMQQYFG